MTRTQMDKPDLFLVGSVAVPEDTVEAAMGIATEELGDRLFALPDGEVGVRQMWSAALSFTTYAPHPDLEQVADDGRRAEHRGELPAVFESTNADLRATWRVKPGRGPLSFEGYLPYADAAIGSYDTFRRLKDQGKIAADVRFQVALPTPAAALWGPFKAVESWPALQTAYLQGLRSEVARILEVVPADELSVQWDYCIEICDIAGTVSGRRELDQVAPWVPDGSAEEKLRQHTDPSYVGALAAVVPERVRYGYHLCLGTFPTFPMTPVDDLSWIVRVANALAVNTPRRVDFFHLPAEADADRDYFAPLADLEIDGAAVFLGLGHRDGPDAIARRGRAAREFLPTFGISHFCGYGREDRDRVTDLMRDLRAGADLLALDAAS